MTQGKSTRDGEIIGEMGKEEGFQFSHQSEIKRD